MFILYALLFSLTESGDRAFHITSAGVKTEIPPANNIKNRKLSSFDIKARFVPESKLLQVLQRITWVNTGSVETDRIYLHFYPNAYQNDNTIFAGARRIPDESRVSVVLDELKVDGRPGMPVFANTDIFNPNDSTVAYVELNRKVSAGESVVLELSYHYRIPLAFGRMGYSITEDFFFLAQWYIKPGVFDNDKWICSPFFPYAEFYSDFANYRIEITAPKEYSILATGNTTSTVIVDKARRKHIFRAENVHDFAWTAFTDGYVKESFESESGYKRIKTTIVAPRGFEEFSPRYKRIVQEAFKFCADKFGVFPFGQFSLVIAPPRSGKIGNMEYPCLSVVSHSPYLGERQIELEELVVHEFIHQYFYAAVATNESYEGWLDEGLTSYLTSTMLREMGYKKISYFPWFTNFSVRGLELLRIGEIPIIYSLANVESPFELTAMLWYYGSLHSGILADSSYLFSDRAAYRAIIYAKGELFFKGLEGIIGRKTLLGCIRDYYRNYRFRHTEAADLLSLIQKKSRKDLSWYFQHYYRSAAYCDYSIESLTKIPGGTAYSVAIRRDGSASYPCDVALYTSAGVLKKRLSTIRGNQIILFSTTAEVFGAEIDPERKNIFDANFANNSFMLDSQFSGITYFSIRWFYWMQSILLFFGGLT